MNQSIVRGIILLIGVIVALIAGSATANFDLVFLVLGAVVVGALLFVSIIWRYVLGLSLIIAVLGFSWYPMGISLGPDELSYVLVGALIFTQIWRPFDRRPSLEPPAESFVRLFAKIGVFWVIYVGIELVWRLLEVRFYGESGMKNILKSYVGIIMPTFLIVYFIHRPTAIVPLKKPELTILWTLLAGLALGIAIRIYQNSFGASVMDEQSGRMVAGPLVIPGILIVEGMYALRFLGPLAVLVGTLFLTTRSTITEKRSLKVILLSLAVTFLGLLGSLVSGGRATIALALMMVIFVLLIRKAFLPLIGCACGFVTLILSVNLIYSEIEATAPHNVLRSINWMLIDGGGKASGDIEASTRWRQILFEESVAEWSKSWRNTLIGRGYKGFADTDRTDYIDGGYYDKIDLALQRGATHSLLSDSLLAFGILGTVFYYSLLVAQTAFGLAVLRTKNSRTSTRNFAWIVAVLGMQAITVNTLGGTFVGMLNALMVLILVLECHKDREKLETTMDGDTSDRVEATPAIAGNSVS